MAVGLLGTIQTGQYTQYYQLVPVTGSELFTTFDSPHCGQKNQEFPAAVTESGITPSCQIRGRTWRFLPVPADETLAGESEVMLGDA